MTIAGESAGAQSVLALLASPLARGLFSKAIAESPYGIASHTRAQALRTGIEHRKGPWFEGRECDRGRIAGGIGGGFCTAKG